jgi:hypothetical protein
MNALMHTNAVANVSIIFVYRAIAAMSAILILRRGVDATNSWAFTFVHYLQIWEKEKMLK